MCVSKSVCKCEGISEGIWEGLVSVCMCVVYKWWRKTFHAQDFPCGMQIWLILSIAGPHIPHMLLPSVMRVPSHSLPPL